MEGRERGIPQSEVPKSAEMAWCYLCHRKERHAKDCPVVDPAERDYNDIMLLGYAMTDGDEQMLGEAREFLKNKGFSEERIADSITHQHQRNDVHQALQAEFKRRLAEHPEPTDEEVGMGIYIEQLEPHVRDAVRVMRRKGYVTKGSGFSEFDAEITYLDRDKDSFANLDSATTQAIATLGARVIHKGNGISFSSKGMDMEALKRKWDAIAAALPDKGSPAPQMEPYDGNLHYNAIKAGKLPHDAEFEALWKKNHQK